MDGIIENIIIGISLYVLVIAVAIAPSMCCGLERIGNDIILWIEKKMNIKEES